jgi:hypothetical protein
MHSLLAKPEENAQKYIQSIKVLNFLIVFFNSVLTSALLDLPSPSPIPHKVNFSAREKRNLTGFEVQ